LFEFLLDVEDLEGTNANRRIDEFAAKGKEASQSYQTKTTTGVPNAHSKRYTPELLAYIKQELGHLLYFFGYTNHPVEENKTAYF
jgi:hypothetical protein